MEIGNEISQKIRSAIKAKLIEQGAYVDDELPDYIMVMVANKKSQKQMTDDLSLFLGLNTEKFTSWLHSLLKKLQSINTDEPNAKPKTKEKNKGEKRKHRSSQGDREKKTDGERQRKSSTGEKEKLLDKKTVEDKTEPGTARVKPIQKTEETTIDELNIIENTDEFNEENSAAEVKEITQTSSTGKPPPTKVSKVDKSTDVKKSGTKSSVSSSKSKSSSSTSTKSRHDVGRDARKKPISIVASVKRRYEELDEDEEEYDPTNPAVGSVASVVRGPTRKSSIPQSLQANKSLLMKAVTEAEKSVTTKKKTDISPESSKPAMRSDRQPINLKHRLKTAAGLGLLSRSKRAEMNKKSTATTTTSLDTVKKPRKSDEGFENIKYTIKNEATSPLQKKVSPKAPASAPTRMATTALRDIGGGSKVKRETLEPESEEDQDEEGSEISSEENEIGDEEQDDTDSDVEEDEEESEEEIEIEITDRAAQTLLNMRDQNINLSEWKCTIDCRESGSQTDLTESGSGLSNIHKLSKEKLEEIDACLLDMFIENLMPFDFVENEPFKMFAKTLESKYHFPKRKKLVTELGILYNTVRDLIKTDISGNQSAAFTYSSWSTTDLQCYNTVKVNFITGDWILRSLTLKTSPISELGCYDEIARNLDEIKSKWMFTNPILVTSDTKTEQKIVEVLDWQHVVCFGSGIHAVIRKALSMRAVSNFLEQGRKLVSEILESPVVLEVFGSKKRVILPVELHNTDLICDDTETWSSSLEMLTVLSELAPALHAAVMDTKLINSGVDLRSQLFDFNQQSSLESLIKILSTFKTATEILTSIEQPTLQKVVPIFVKLEKVLDEKVDDSSMISDMKTYIKEEIKTLMNTCKETCLLACLLHPQTKQMAFVSPVEKDEIKSFLFNEVKSLCESEFSKIDDKNKKFRKGKKGIQRQTKAMSEVSTETDVRRVIVNTDCEDNGAQVDPGRSMDNLPDPSSEEETSYQEDEDGGNVRVTQDDCYEDDKTDSLDNVNEKEVITSLDRSVSRSKLNLSITVENDWLDDVICATDDPRSPEETAKIELNLYMAEPASSQNPLMWWKEKQRLYPHTACIARKFLAIPASSVKSEDIFHLEKAPENKLIQVKPEYIDMMLFLKENKSVYESE